VYSYVIMVTLLDLSEDTIWSIIVLLPLETRLIIHSISTFMYRFRFECIVCKQLPKLPVWDGTMVKCYDCIPMNIFYRPQGRDRQLWKRYDYLRRDMQNRAYLRCDRCKVLCTSSEWYHFHRSFHCY
jgi:hypothetical protein